MHTCKDMDKHITPTFGFSKKNQVAQTRDHPLLEGNVEMLAWQLEAFFFLSYFSPLNSDSVRRKDGVLNKQLAISFWRKNVNTYCWWFRNPTNQLRLLVYSHYFQGFLHPRWCGISAINSRKPVVVLVTIYLWPLPLRWKPRVEIFSRVYQ